MSLDTETVEQGNSSQPDEVIDPEITESPEGDSGVAEQGVEGQEEALNEAESEQETVAEELKTKKPVPPENVIKMKERLIEKAEKRVRELEAENKRLQFSTPPPAQIDPQQYMESVRQRTGGRYTTEELSDWAPVISVLANDIANDIVSKRMAPMSGTIAEAQYEGVKKILRSDTENFPDFADLEPDMDKQIEEYKLTQPHLLNNETALRSLATYIRGKNVKKLVEAAEKRGRDSVLKNKQIVGALNVNSGVGSKSGVTTGFTSADKAFAEKNDMTIEDARDIRISREKKSKEK